MQNNEALRDLKTAIEFNLGEPCTRQLERLAGPAQCFDLPIQRLDTFMLGRACAITFPHGRLRCA